MRTFADILLVLTVCGNVFLGLILVFNKHYIRFGWLTVSCAMAVLADFFLQYAKFNVHSQFEPLRQFCFYAVFLMLNLLVIWEGWKWRNRAVEYLTGVQLALMVLWLALRDVRPWWAYELQYASVTFNVFCIIWFIVIFRRDANESRQASEA